MNHTPVIRIVDDDRDLLESLRACLSTFAWRIETYESAEAFLAGTDFAAPGCLILDVAMPGMKGPELQLELKRRGVEMPIIFLSGHGTIAMAVAAMARGAATFLEKPVEPQLGISVTTVKTHRANIFAKLGVKSAVELTKLLVLVED